ncbi:hypothetical protein BV898_17260 [Hypsibius exemplaris]|uniref:Kazal-like domain-containing protein n=1 Tax=Hypsibius exemplaris TaxID=2072580 RepID=A0A9X6NF11_HYPEX|nr:hypothetical protein BV898_17260 [Hypsibius exemplaris]
MFLGSDFIWRLTIFMASITGLEGASVSRQEPPPGEEPELPACQCQSDNSQPVCGTNDESYDNFCLLRCASRSIPSLGGKCRGRCPCPDAPKDLKKICDVPDGLCPPNIPKGQRCGTDNVTYADTCKFICAQQTIDGLGIKCAGACPCPKAESSCSRCPEEYRPICGTDNITYGNYCIFACARLTRPGLSPDCRHECPCTVDTNS